MQKSVTVYSNDPRQPRFRLTMSGQVEVIAGFDPNRVNFREVAKGSTHTETVKIMAKEPDKLKISEVVSTKPEEIQAELIEQDGSPAIKVTLNAPDKPGRIAAQVKAKTNLESPSEIQLYVYGRVSPNLAVNRSYVFFSPPRNIKDASLPGKNLARIAATLGRRSSIAKLRVRSLDGKPFELTGIEDPDGAVIGHLEQDGEEWNVYLMLTSDPAKRRGTINIRTDREDQPTIAVKYGTGLRSRPRPSRATPGARKITGPAHRAPPDKPHLAPRIRKMPPRVKRKLAPVRTKGPIRKK